MRYFLVISLNLMALGAINRGYTQAYCNVIKDPSFEENSEFWEENYSLRGNVNKHYKDTTTLYGNYVGLTSTEAMGSADLCQKFIVPRNAIPRTIEDFDLNDKTKSLMFQIRWHTKEQNPGHYKFGFTLKGRLRNHISKKLVKELSQENFEENKWFEYGCMIYDEWINAGLPADASLEEITLWVEGFWGKEHERCGEYGVEVTWDNIRLLSKNFDIDGAVLSIDSPKEAFIGQVYIPKATVKNVGTLPIGESYGKCVISKKNGPVVYEATSGFWYLRPEDSTGLGFGEWIPKEKSSYNINVCIDFTNDQKDSNNSLTQKLEVKPEMDGAVMRIDSPKEAFVGQSYAPKATLKNIGILDIEGIKAICEIIKNWEEKVYTDTIMNSEYLLKPDDLLQIDFKEWVPESPNYYLLTVTSLVDDDQYLGNNALSKGINVKTGILENKVNKLKVIKIEPSIFSNKAMLYLPKGEKVRIYDPSGKLVKELYDSDRDGRIFFGSTLKPGVYFYRIGDKIGKVVKIE